MAKKQNRYRAARPNRKGMLRKGIKTVFSFITAVCAVVLLSSGLAHGYWALLHAPWLRLGEVDISGLKHLERQDVLNAMQVPRNASVLTLNMNELAARVEALPWVKSAVVRLDLPRRLVVEVAEREPIAVIAAEDFLLLDEDGKLFLRISPDENPGLILVTGFTGSNLQEGETLPPQPLRELRRLLPALKRAQGWLPAQLITECRWRSDEGFVLFVTQKAIPIELGLDDPDQALGRLQRIFAMLKEHQWFDSVTRIDLDYPNRAYVEGQFGTATHGS